MRVHAIGSVWDYDGPTLYFGLWSDNLRSNDQSISSSRFQYPHVMEIITRLGEVLTTNGVYIDVTSCLTAQHVSIWISRSQLTEYDYVRLFSTLRRAEEGLQFWSHAPEILH